MATIDLWQPAVTVYKGSERFLSDSRQSSRAKVLYAVTNVVTDLTHYKDWTTRNSIRDGPMVEDLEYVQIDEQLASELSRVYQLNKWNGDMMSVASTPDFVNMCGTKTVSGMQEDISKLIAAVESVSRADLQEESAVKDSPSPLDAVTEEVMRYLSARAAGNGKSQVLGLDMSSACAKWWITFLRSHQSTMVFVSPAEVPSFVSEKLQIAASGKTAAVLSLVHSTSSKKRTDSLVLATAFAMILHWIHPIVVRDDTILLDTSSIPAWGHFWSDNVWRLNDLDRSKVRFIDVVRKWTTIAQISVEVSAGQRMRTQTILNNRDLIREATGKLRNVDRSGYVRQKMLHSSTQQDVERLISKSVWCDFYRSVLQPKEEHGEVKPTECMAATACGITPHKIAEAAPMRVTSGKCYTVADSIRVNMLECMAKWPEWSSGSIFSKISGYESKCFFSGADYVATDPKSRVVMIYPADDSWVSSTLLNCWSPLASEDATPETRLKVSIFAGMMSDGKVSKGNYKLLRKGFMRSLDEGITAGRNIARKEMLKIGKLSVVEEQMTTLMRDESIAAVVRELLHDLLGEENLNEVSLRTTRRNRCYFAKFYDRGEEAGYDEFIVDRKVLIEKCRYWHKTFENDKIPYTYLKLNKRGAVELEISDKRWHITDTMIPRSVALFYKDVPLGTRLGDTETDGRSCGM